MEEAETTGWWLVGVDLRNKRHVVGSDPPCICKAVGRSRICLCHTKMPSPMRRDGRLRDACEANEMPLSAALEEPGDITQPVCLKCIRTEYFVFTRQQEGQARGTRRHR